MSYPSDSFSTAMNAAIDEVVREAFGPDDDDDEEDDEEDGDFDPLDPDDDGEIFVEDE